tara:strand:+ start:2075 stop:2443 length:369 start_codon:yes stop_codon:yes gene_type:complete
MYVHRLNGDIIGSGANPQTGRSPEVADESNTEWVSYLESIKPVKTQFTSLEYLARFSSIEENAIITASDSNIEIRKFYFRLLGATFIDINDPRTEQGIDALIAAELLEPSRKTDLLTPETIG